MVADKLERADERTRVVLLRIPLGNIDRWLAHGHTAPHRLEQWRQIIVHAHESEEGFRVLVRLLRDRSQETERLRDFAPFAGVLTTQERRQAAPECAYNF